MYSNSQRSCLCIRPLFKQINKEALKQSMHVAPLFLECKLYCIPATGVVEKKWVLKIWFYTQLVTQCKNSVKNK